MKRTLKNVAASASQCGGVVNKGDQHDDSNGIDFNPSDSVESKLKAIYKMLAAADYQSRTKAEVDAYIQEERESWER